MRRIWGGEVPWEGASAPAGPRPVQPGGPPIFTSASGPTALPRAAKWADGWLGANMAVEVESMKTQVQAHLDAWEQAGRATRPYLVNSLFYVLGDGARQRLADAATDYMGRPRIPSPFWRPPRPQRRRRENGSRQLHGGGLRRAHLHPDLR